MYTKPSQYATKPRSYSGGIEQIRRSTPALIGRKTKPIHARITPRAHCCPSAYVEVEYGVGVGVNVEATQDEDSVQEEEPGARPDTPAAAEEEAAQVLVLSVSHTVVEVLVQVVVTEVLTAAEVTAGMEVAGVLGVTAGGVPAGAEATEIVGSAPGVTQTLPCSSRFWSHAPESNSE